MIQLTLLELIIEIGSPHPTKDCVHDSLRIYDGPNSDSPLFGGRAYCAYYNRVRPRIKPSTSNEVFVVFKSDNAESWFGFKLAWIQQGMVECSVICFKRLQHIGLTYIYI